MEGERADQVAVDEEIGVIDTFVERLFHGPVKREMLPFAGVFKFLANRVFHLVVVLIREDVGLVLLQHGTVWRENPQINGLDTGSSGDVLQYIEVELQFLYLAEDACLSVAFVERRTGEVGYLQHGSAGDNFSQFGFFLIERLILLLHSSILLADLPVLLRQLLVLAVQ